MEIRRWTSEQIWDVYEGGPEPEGFPATQQPAWVEWGEVQAEIDRLREALTADALAFAMYAQQRCGGPGSTVDVGRARLFWNNEDAEQHSLWRSKARGVLVALGEGG